MNQNIKNRINELAGKKIPFLFLLSYDGNKGHVQPINEIDSDNILFNIDGKHNSKHLAVSPATKQLTFEKSPISFELYNKQFQKVLYHLKRGDSYLTNLTCETPIKCNLNLLEIYNRSRVRYKIWFRNHWVVFSPETFVKIVDGKIFSFPMKGTIDATLPNAEEQIINNKKEAAEHATIVDLIRNDLSRIARDISVDKYRYIDRIKTNQGELLQVSSQISGTLPDNYLEMLGDLLTELLPAGSISGAPKEKTIEIIKTSETHQRNFYTGICGVFDGKNLDTGVMIRFIENRHNQLYFKSGGGITVNSQAEEEYNEMVQKVYLPFS